MRGRRASREATKRDRNRREGLAGKIVFLHAGTTANIRITMYQYLGISETVARQRRRTRRRRRPWASSGGKNGAYSGEAAVTATLNFLE